LASIPDAPRVESAEVPIIIVSSEQPVVIPEAPAANVAPQTAPQTAPLQTAPPQPVVPQPADTVVPVVSPVVAAPPAVTAPATPDVAAPPAAVPVAASGVAAVNDPTFTPAPHLVAAAAKPAMPALSGAAQYVPARPAPQRPVAPVLAPPAPVTLRKRKGRGVIRGLFTFLIIIGMIGGGLYAAKRYVLDIGKWADNIKPLADDVAEARGLQFKDPVPVVEMPVAEYAVALATNSLGPAFPTAATRAPELRALGLLQGELDLLAIGETAMIDAPAFYDGAAKKIYVVDLPNLSPQTRSFALQRALTQALLDQHFGWAAREGLTASQVFGRLAVADGDALSVAASMVSADAAGVLAADQLGLVQQYGATTNSPYLAAVAGRAGSVMAPTFHGMRTNPTAIDTLMTTQVVSDGGVLDLVRGEGNPTIDPAVGAGETMGMAYWYYALASRIDDQQAWLAATNWAGDTTNVVQNAGGACVSATIAAFTEGGVNALKSAFDAWAATAPLEARTTVQQLDNNRLAIAACDPGAAAVTMTPDQPLLFGGAPVERALVEAIVPDPAQAVGVPVCLALQARFRNVPFSLPGDQATLLGLAGGWAPPYVVANIDLGATCLAASNPAPAPVPAPVNG
jgi:hypothetical protein